MFIILVQIAFVLNLSITFSNQWNQGWTYHYYFNYKFRLMNLHTRSTVRNKESIKTNNSKRTQLNHCSNCSQPFRVPQSTTRHNGSIIHAKGISFVRHFFSPAITDTLSTDTNRLIRKDKYCENKNNNESLVVWTPHPPQSRCPICLSESPTNTVSLTDRECRKSSNYLDRFIIRCVADVCPVGFDNVFAVALCFLRSMRWFVCCNVVGYYEFLFGFCEKLDWRLNLYLVF